MTMDSESVFDVLAVAQRTVLRAQLQDSERQAVQLLSRRRGLATAPLCPPSQVILVVCLDGVHLGRVRRAGSRGSVEQWVAVPLGPWRPHGPYVSAMRAAFELALAATGRDPDAGQRSGSGENQNTATAGR